MDLAAELATHRDFLVALAYRMLGSLQSAEDVVQEAFVRAERAQSGSGADSGAAAEAGDEIREPRAWLTRIVTRLALDELKSARAQRETYVGPWLPEPLLHPTRRQRQSVPRSTRRIGSPWTSRSAWPCSPCWKPCRRPSGRCTCCTRPSACR